MRPGGRKRKRGIGGLPGGPFRGGRRGDLSRPRSGLRGPGVPVLDRCLTPRIPSPRPSAGPAAPSPPTVSPSGGGSDQAAPVGRTRKRPAGPSRRGAHESVGEALEVLGAAPKVVRTSSPNATFDAGGPVEIQPGPAAMRPRARAGWPGGGAQRVFGFGLPTTGVRRTQSNPPLIGFGPSWAFGLAPSKRNPRTTTRAPGVRSRQSRMSPLTLAYETA
jgi:hypothetical protein